MAWRERRFYRQLPDPARSGVIFDPGAAGGSKAAIFYRHGSVVSVEPSRHAVANLRKRFAHCGNLTISHGAVSDWFGFSMAAPSQQKVNLVTIDTLIAEYGAPRYIKAHIEGYEWLAVQGMSQPRELLSAEFNRRTFCPSWERAGPTSNYSPDPGMRLRAEAGRS
jgi:hypothetical protein